MFCWWRSMGSIANVELLFEQSNGIPPCSRTASRFLGSLPERNMEIAASSNASASCSSLEMVQSFSTCWDSSMPVDENAGFIEKVTHDNTFYRLNVVALEHQPNVNVVPHHLCSPLFGPTPSFSCLLNSAHPDNMNNFCPVEGSTAVSTVSPADYQLGIPNQCCSVNPSPENPRSRIQVSARECEGLDYGTADQKEEQNVANRAPKSPSDGRKRKRISDCLILESNSNFNKAQRIDSDQSKDGSKFSNDPKKMKKARDTCDDLNKSNVGHSQQDQSQTVDAPKEDYIHVRARRGQATNSHSLAERVRREKISERMRFLQDLVPGCNKVTGKAVMLDEIINYVQSLQRQVEFLSMKLATVIPNIDVEGTLLKIFHSDGSADALGFTHNINSTSYPINGYPLESIESGTDVMQCLKNYGDTLKSSMNSELFQMDQVTNTCSDELQGIV